MELAIDTSTENAGIALSERGVLVEERIWNAGRNHTVELMPRVAALLEDHGAAASALDAVFVATGPGGFTAVRVGISAAKGLALASGATLVGVGTMWIEASPFAGRGLPIRPIMDAGRGELIVGALRPHGRRSRRGVAAGAADRRGADRGESRDIPLLRPEPVRRAGAARRGAGRPGTLPRPRRGVAAPFLSLRAGLGAPAAGRSDRRRQRGPDLREAARDLHAQPRQGGAP